MLWPISVNFNLIFNMNYRFDKFVFHENILNTSVIIIFSLPFFPRCQNDMHCETPSVQSECSAVILC